MLKRAMSVEPEPSREYLDWLLKSVSVDHDGTVADSRSAVTLEFNRRHKTNHKIFDLNHWNAVYDWGLGIGMTQEEAEAENYDLWYNPETIFKADPIPGAIEFLHELYMRDVDFVINSSRIPALRVSTIEWYEKHAPFIDPLRIHTGIAGFEGIISKINTINAVRRRLHIEDVPEHARAIHDYTKAHIILISNRDGLTDIEPGRITQIRGKDGEMPDFWDVNKMFFG